MPVHGTASGVDQLGPASHAMVGPPGRPTVGSVDSTDGIAALDDGGMRLVRRTSG